MFKIWINICFPIQISILLINFVHLKNVQSEKHKISTSISYFSSKKKKILKWFFINPFQNVVTILYGARMVPVLSRRLDNCGKYGLAVVIILY